MRFGSSVRTGATIMPATAPKTAARPQPSASIQPTRIPTSRLDTGIVRGRAHGEPERREPEEDVDAQQHDAA